MPRRLLHLPRHALRVLAIAVAVGVVVFFALTRTQVGRDGLRRQLESQFAGDFEGRLEIGQLTGNLVQDLYATDVRLVDPEGSVVMQIDSLVAKPRWRDLFSRRISVRSLALFQPQVDLVYQADSTWNLAEVFQRREQRLEMVPTKWTFETARVTVEHGVVQTRYETFVPPLVEQEWLFNYAESRATGIQLEATVEWRPDSRLIDVLHATASVPEVALDIDTLSGQFVWEPGRVLVNELDLQAGEMEVAGSLGIQRFSDEADPDFDLALRPSQLDLDMLRRLMPRLPMAGQATAAVEVHGPISRLVIEELDVQRGQSRLRTAGTLVGLPDSLGYDLHVTNSAVAVSDIEALLPDVSLPALPPLGVVAVRLDAAGSIEGWREGASLAVQTQADLDLRSTSGTVRGRATVGCVGEGACRYGWDLAVDSLDLGPLVQRRGLASRLAGRVRGEGRGLSLDSLHATVTADLTHSQLAGRRIDTLHIEGSMRDLRAQATGFVDGEAGRLFTSGALNLKTSKPSYDLGLITRDLDVGRLLLQDSLDTRLNTQWTIDGSGWSLDDLQGALSVEFDASAVRAGGRERAVPPHRTTFTVRPVGADEPRVQVGGDVIDLQLSGTTAAAPLEALLALWAPLVEDAVREQLHKPYGTPLSAPERTGLADHALESQAQARAVLQEAGLDQVILNLKADVKRGDILAALFPVLPVFAGSLQADFQVTANAELARVGGNVMADTLGLVDTHAQGVAIDIDLSMGYMPSLLDVLTLDVAAHADSLFLARQAIAYPELILSLKQKQGTLHVAAERNAEAGPFRLAAGIDIFPDRYRVALNEVFLALGTYEWTQPAAQHLDLYDNAVVVPSFVLESRPSAEEPVQRLRLQGAVSSLPLDTMYVAVEQIGLRQLSDFMGLKRALGGRLNGQVALTGTTQPELTGDLRVNDLVFDGHWLGQLKASSSYVPGLPDVALDVQVSPSGMDAAEAGGLQPAENRLRLDGTFRLPRAATPDLERDPGALDLRATVERADAFFFENLFSVVDNVEGALSGHGRVRGTFDFPIFEAELALADGQLDVPRFGLRYFAEGPVTVDESGIHLQSVQVSDPTGGRATVDGGILFNDYQFFSFALSGQIDDLQIMDVLSSRDLPFFGQIWASGNATLTGPVQNAFLRSADAVTSAESEVFIPILETETVVDPGFIVFADSTGQVLEAEQPRRRTNILADRPAGERTFLDGLEMDLNIFAPQGSTVHLVIDPLLGDVINAVGSGRIQLQRQEGEFSTFGTLEVTSGDYLFTAGEVFVRRFLIQDGTITWDGDPLDARLDINGAYHTRASRAGLPEEISTQLQSFIPVVVELHITGRVSTPQVDLSLAVDRSTQETISDTQFLEAYLNQPDLAAQHATSVLLTNTFLLSAQNPEGDIAGSAAFNSVSQLVSSQLNRYLNQVLPNADFTFGVQGDETRQDLDVTAGLALRLLNERLVIRGHGVYRGVRPSDDVGADAQQGLQGEFVVEVRLNPSVSVEVFFRRESDVFSESLLTSTTGAGLSYQTRFPTWRVLLERLFGGADKVTPDDDAVVEVQEQ